MNSMRKRNFTARFGGCIMMVMLVGVVSGLADVRGVIKKKDGVSLSGMIRWQPLSKVYVITDEKGITMQIPLSQVASVKVQKPAEWDNAVKMIQQGQHAAAIPVLEKIMEVYTALELDISAAGWLVEAYLKVNDPKKAIKMYEKVADAYPGSVLSRELTVGYWDALFKTGDFVKLRSTLTKAIEEGPRDLAALAQIKRGDMDKKDGNLRAALVDGYLRTIVLFEQVKEVQPEALYKAAKCFDDLGEHSHAEKMRKKLLAEFPQDQYTEKLKSGT